MRVTFQLNGKPVGVEVEPRMHLADCLRDEVAADRNPSRMRVWRVRRVHGHCRWGRGPILSDARGSGRGMQWSPSRVSRPMTL